MIDSDLQEQMKQVASAGLRESPDLASDPPLSTEEPAVVSNEPLSGLQTEYTPEHKSTNLAAKSCGLDFAHMFIERVLHLNGTLIGFLPTTKPTRGLIQDFSRYRLNSDHSQAMKLWGSYLEKNL